MERCPNCGQQSRAGAKFCTTCGYRMPESESNGEMELVAPDDSSQRGDEAAEGSSQNSGWPAPTNPADPSPHAAWAAAPSANPADSVPSAGESPDEFSSSVWASGTNSTWPTPPVGVSDAVPAADEPQRPNPPSDVEDFELEAETDDAAADNTATDRISRLLDELRDAIFAFHGQSAVDLAPVIADLEVAVTPPGAINPEKLSELRDALLAAREKPRDIDTIVALTGQLDALVALVFAYDRTIAAIERALEVLRRD